MKKYFLIMLLSVASYGQWGGLAANQMVTETFASTAGFILRAGQSHGSTNKCMTKDEANEKYVLDTDYQTGISGNQLLQVDKWATGVLPREAYNTNTFYCAGYAITIWFDPNDGLYYTAETAGTLVTGYYYDIIDSSNPAAVSYSYNNIISGAIDSSGSGTGDCT